VAQLGAGLVGTGVDSYPNVIDTYQTFINGSPISPDSASRIDAELVMDVLRTLVSIETTLGSNVQGVFASLAARLNQALPGSGGLPGLVTFTNTDTVAIPGTQHNVGQAALLFQIYDAASPARAMDPGAYFLEVDTGSYDVFIDFAVATSGLIALGITSPLYVATFTNQTTVTVLGTTHQLGTADIFFQVYDAATPRRRAMEPGSLTVHQTSFTVTMTFVTPQSGLLVLSAGGPMYAVNFTNTTTLSIPGSVHQFGTRAILFQAYNAANPRAALGDPGVTVNPTSFDVQVTFATPTSGRFLLAPTSTLTGKDFDIRDSGVVDQSAVRINSQQGNLHLQAGLGDKIIFENKLGALKMVLNTLTTSLGIGLAVPAHQLHLSANDAVKPLSSAWIVESDATLKTDIRPFEEGLDTVVQLEPVRYRPVDTQEEAIGLVAQEVQAIAPYLVRAFAQGDRPRVPWRRGPRVEAPPPLLAVDRHALDHLFINAFKTLEARLATLQAAYDALQADVAQLQAALPPPLSEDAPS
jgi:Chaperone of endosialidase